MLSKIVFLAISFIAINANAYTKIKITNLIDFSTENKEKMTLIVDRLEEVINTNLFRHMVKSHLVDKKKTYLYNKNQTNNQIFKKIMEGKENTSLKKDYTWELDLHMRLIVDTRLLAFTTLDATPIYISYLHFMKDEDSAIADTLCHEYMHQLGYDHDDSLVSKRLKTVPYGVGGICGFVYMNMFRKTTTQARPNGILKKRRKIKYVCARRYKRVERAL